MTNDETQYTSPSGWPITNDNGVIAVREASEMFRRDQQRQQDAEAARSRVLAAFPDAPPDLAAAMMQYPSLVDWLAQIATQPEQE